MELEDGWLVMLSCKHKGLRSDPWQAYIKARQAQWTTSGISVLDREQEAVTDLLSSQSS